MMLFATINRMRLVWGRGWLGKVTRNRSRAGRPGLPSRSLAGLRELWFQESQCCRRVLGQASGYRMSVARPAGL